MFVDGLSPQMQMQQNVRLGSRRTSQRHAAASSETQQKVVLAYPN